MTRAELQALIDRARTLQQPPTNRASRDTSRDWCRISMRDDGSDEADVYVYDEIGFFGTTASDFADQLAGISAKAINLHINSPGGSVFDGVAIFNALKDHPAQVNVTIDALAASAASFIAQAGDTIRMGRQAMMMIHDASGFTVGNAGEHREMADLLDKLSNAIAEIYAARTGFPTAHWRNQMLAETWYSAQEAVDAMLADETTRDADDDEDDQAKVERAAAKLAADFDLSVFQYPGREAAPAPDLAAARMVRGGLDPERAAAAVAKDGDPPKPDGAKPPPADGGDPDSERLAPAAEVADDPQPVDEPVETPDLAAVMRGAFQEAAAPPPFEFDADIFRSVVTERVNNAPAIKGTKVPQPPVDEPVVADAREPDDPSGSLSSDGGTIGFGDVFRAAVTHRANNAPAPATRFPDDPAPSVVEPLDMGRIIMEAAIR